MKSLNAVYLNQFLFSLGCLYLMSTSVGASQSDQFELDHKSDIYAYQLEKLCELDGSGIYDKAMKKLGFTYKVLPAVRADILMMKEGACVFPVDMRYMKRDKPLIHSDRR